MIFSLASTTNVGALTLFGLSAAPEFSSLAREYGSTQQKKILASTNGCLIAILVPVMRDRTTIDDPIVGRALLLPDPENAEDLKQLLVRHVPLRLSTTVICTDDATPLSAWLNDASDNTSDLLTSLSLSDWTETHGLE